MRWLPSRLGLGLGTKGRFETCHLPLFNSYPSYREIVPLLFVIFAYIHCECRYRVSTKYGVLDPQRLLRIILEKSFKRNSDFWARSKFQVSNRMRVYFNAVLGKVIRGKKQISVVNWFTFFRKYFLYSSKWSLQRVLCKEKKLGCHRFQRIYFYNRYNWS